MNRHLSQIIPLLLSVVVFTLSPGCESASTGDGGAGSDDDNGAGGAPVPDQAVMYASPSLPAIAEYSAEDGVRYAVFGTKNADGLPQSVETIVLTRPDGQEIISEYDSDGHLVRVTETEGYRVEFAWDGDDGGTATFFGPDGSSLGAVPFEAGAVGSTTSKPALRSKGRENMRGPNDPRLEDVQDTIELVCDDTGEVINNVMTSLDVHCGERLIGSWPSGRRGGSISIDRPRSDPGGDVPALAQGIQWVLDRLAEQPGINFEMACIAAVIAVAPPLFEVAPVICLGIEAGVDAAAAWQIARRIAATRAIDCSTITYTVRVRRSLAPFGEPWIAWEVDHPEWTFTVDEDDPPRVFTIHARCPRQDWRDLLDLLNSKRADVGKDPVSIPQPQAILMDGVSLIRQGTEDILEDYGFTGLAEALTCAGYAQTTWSEGFECKDEVTDVLNLMKISTFYVQDLLISDSLKWHLKRVYQTQWKWIFIEGELPEKYACCAEGWNRPYSDSSVIASHGLGYRNTFADDWTWLMGWILGERTYEVPPCCPWISVWRGEHYSGRARYKGRMWEWSECALSSIEDKLSISHYTILYHDSNIPEDLIRNGGHLSFYNENESGSFTPDTTMKIAYHTCREKGQ